MDFIVICLGRIRMSFLTAELSAINQPQSQLNNLQNSSQQNVTTIANHSINDHNFTAIENGISFDFQQNLTNGKVTFIKIIR